MLYLVSQNFNVHICVTSFTSVTQSVTQLLRHTLNIFRSGVKLTCRNPVLFVLSRKPINFHVEKTATAWKLFSQPTLLWRKLLQTFLSLFLTLSLSPSHSLTLPPFLFLFQQLLSHMVTQSQIRTRTISLLFKQTQNAILLCNCIQQSNSHYPNERHNPFFKPDRII